MTTTAERQRRQPSFSLARRRRRRSLLISFLWSAVAVAVAVVTNNKYAVTGCAGELRMGMLPRIPSPTLLLLLSSFLFASRIDGAGAIQSGESIEIVEADGGDGLVLLYTDAEGDEQKYNIPPALRKLPHGAMIREAMNLLLEQTLDDMDDLMQDLESFSDAGLNPDETYKVDEDDDEYDTDMDDDDDEIFPEDYGDDDDDDVVPDFALGDVGADAETCEMCNELDMQDGEGAEIDDEEFDYKAFLKQPFDLEVKTEEETGGRDFGGDGSGGGGEDQGSNDASSSSSPSSKDTLQTTHQRKGGTGRQYAHADGALADAEREILVRFFGEVGGTPQLVKDWNWLDPAVDYCAWGGITCERRTARRHSSRASASNEAELLLDAVTRIELPGLLMDGTLPTCIVALPYLEVLNLAFNYIKGPIPVEYGHANFTSTLRELDLSFNQLTGSIPRVIFQRLEALEDLRLNRNDLAGELPFVAGTKKNRLKVLDVSDNRIGGSIPSSMIGASANLEMLVLGSNSLSGTLPSELRHLSALQVLECGTNALSGRIEQVFQNLLPLADNLRNLILSENLFSGTLPPDMWKMTKLEMLILSDNFLSGSLPMVGSATSENTGPSPSLQVLWLARNQLSGPLPKELFTGLQNSLKK